MPNNFELSSPLTGGFPLLKINFAVGETKQKGLSKAQRRIPPEFTEWAYVDTGCSRTVVDRSVVKRLELAVTGSTTFTTARGLQFGETCCLDLTVDPLLRFPDLICACFTNLRTDQYGVLLGLDVLKHFVVELDKDQVVLRRPGIPSGHRNNVPAYFDENVNVFYRDGMGKVQEYRDCGDCSFWKGFGLRKRASKVRRSEASGT